MGAEQTVRIDGTVPVTGTLTPSGTQNVAIVSPATIPVSGTVTTVPSGTQNVAITGQPIGVTPANTSTTPLFTVPGTPPGQQFYFHTIVDSPGVVAANNFMSIFNPLGSGKTVIAYQVSVNPWAAAAATTDVSMNVFRITAASAGTLIAASAVNRLVTAAPNPTTEVRVGNPTVTTVGTTLMGFPPAVTSAGSGISASGTANTVPGASFTMTPGQGVVFTTSAGDVDQRWNMQFIWAEL